VHRAPPAAWQLAAIAVVAFLVRLVPLLRGAGLFGIVDDDDGVYMGSAIALVHGRVPYRDFLLLHPPGIVILLSPLAAIGTALGDPAAFAAARVAFMALGGLNAVLVALVASRAGLGRVAALCGAALYAVWEVPANVERTTWLIAPQNTLLLLALLVLGAPNRQHPVAPRRAAAAGVLLGLATATQLWGAIPGAVVLAWLVVADRRSAVGWLRPAVAYVIGAAVALAAVLGPFEIASNGTLLRYIVADQLGRYSSTPLPIMERLRAFEGLPMTGAGILVIPAALVIVAFAAVAIIVIAAAWVEPVLRPWVALLVAQSGFLLAGPVFFGHYPGWLAPAASLSIGGAAGVVIRGVETRWRSGQVAGAAYGVGVAALVVAAVLHPVGNRIDRTRLDAVVAAARCVTSDSAGLLIATNVLSRDIANGCTVLLDPAGTSYDTDRNLPAGLVRTRQSQPEYQARMVSYYTGGDAALFRRLKSGDGFRPATWAAIRAALPNRLEVGLVTVLLRTPPTPTSARP
jgi:hypothetical protein